MARKKTPEEMAAEQVQESVIDKVNEPQPKQKDAIPAEVDRLLQIYPSYPELYIGSKGEVYTADTKPNIIGGAILYKNPYFNN